MTNASNELFSQYGGTDISVDLKCTGCSTTTLFEERFYQHAAFIFKCPKCDVVVGGFAKSPETQND